MLIGAAAFFIYSLVCCRLMIRQRLPPTPVAIIALVPWLVVALGGLDLASPLMAMKVSLHLKRIAETKRSEYVVRFLFGGAVAWLPLFLLSALPCFGGLFLASRQFFLPAQRPYRET